MEGYLRVNLLGPGSRLTKKIIYRTAVSQRLRNTALQLKKFEASRISRQTSHECGKIVNPAHLTEGTPGTHLGYRLSRHQGHIVAGTMK